MSAVLGVEDLPATARSIEAPADLAARYRALTGWDGPATPPGLAVVLARLGFTAGRPLPPGGVLLGIDVAAAGSLAERGPWQATVAVAERRSSAGHRLVDVETRLTPGEARVRFVLRWPDD